MTSHPLLFLLALTATPAAVWAAVSYIHAPRPPHRAAHRRKDRP